MGADEIRIATRGFCLLTDAMALFGPVSYAGCVITEIDLKKILLASQQLVAERSNAVGSATLAMGAASTTVSTTNCAMKSVPMLAVGGVRHLAMRLSMNPSCLR